MELNEAFAAQVVPCRDEWGIDPEKLNPYGGAIALGHPFGMTGARIMTTLLNNLDANDGTIGLETMCVAGGMGQAMIVERLTEASALRLHGQHLPLAHRRGCDAPLVREAGLEDEIEIDSAGTGGWHVGDPPDARATARPRRARHRRSRARRGRSRAEDFEHFDLLLAMDRENLRDLLALAPDDEGGATRCGCCASSTRRRRRATSTCPTRTTAATTASRRCSTSSRPPAAGCSPSCADGEPRARRRVDGSAARERVGGGSINEALRVELDDGRAAFVKTRADVPPGEFAAEAAGLAWLGRARRACGVPEVLARRRRR